MKKNIFIVAFFSFLICACDREEKIIEDNSHYWGTGFSEKNGGAWVGQPFAVINTRNAISLSIGIDSIDQFNIRRESLVLLKIPVKPGTYPAFNTSLQKNDSLVGASFYYVDHDVLLGAYKVLELDSSSFITLISYDTISREVKGTFDLTFVPEHKPYSSAPDTLRLYKGYFHTKVMN